jgi:UDP-N-acetyl-D-mannosaminuronic acid dehydrogenase
MLVNENLAALVVDKGAALAGGSLWGKTIGLLGMTFKADNDDTRESLSYRVKKGYEFKGARVLFNDPYLEGSVPLEELEQECDVLALCTPHSEYRSYDFKLPVVDVWGVFERPSIEVLPGKKE